jgi:hypothetical protein
VAADENIRSHFFVKDERFYPRDDFMVFRKTNLKITGDVNLKESKDHVIIIIVVA